MALSLYYPIFITLILPLSILHGARDIQNKNSFRTCFWYYIWYQSWNIWGKPMLIQIKKAKTYATSGGLEIPKQNALLFGNTTQQGFFKDDLTTFSFLIYYKESVNKSRAFYRSFTAAIYFTLRQWRK